MKPSLALIIGNANYSQAKHQLENAVNDAVDFSKKLELLGYEVKLGTDCNEQEFEAHVNWFGNELLNYQVGLFYFSGHGLQIEEANYLTAVDTSFFDESSAKHSSIKLALIIDKMERSGAEIKILILDACRDNPLPNTFRTLHDSGLAPVFAPKGTLVAFSTSPGQRAKDRGAGRNSVYTGALLSHINDPYIPIEEFFKRVRASIFHSTSGKQISWEHTSLIGDYFFNFGQMQVAKELPYIQSVVADEQWISTGSPFDKIITELKSHDWYRQKPAIEGIGYLFLLGTVNENEQFLFGRNLLQAADGGGFTACEILLKNLSAYLGETIVNGKCHVLNGILYEMYFNSKGKFRGYNFKNRFVNEIYALHGIANFKSSFHFIREQLLGVNELIYIPDDPLSPMAIDVILQKEEVPQAHPLFGESLSFTHTLSAVKYGITELLQIPSFSHYDVCDYSKLLSLLEKRLCAPAGMLRVNCNEIDISQIMIKYPSGLESKISIHSSVRSETSEGWPNFDKVLNK